MFFNDPVVNAVNNLLKDQSYSSVLEKLEKIINNPDGFPHQILGSIGDPVAVIPGFDQGEEMCCANVYVFTEHSYEKVFSPNTVMKALDKYFDSCGSAIQKVTVFTPLNGIFRMERDGFKILNRFHDKGIKIDVFAVHDLVSGLIQIPYRDFSVKPNKLIV